MQQLVSITAQGQITIPALLRRNLGLDKYRKALVRADEEKIIVEPLPDILSLGGIIKDKALKKKSLQQILNLEKETIIKSLQKKHSFEKL